MSDEKIYFNEKDAKIDQLLQVMAVLIDKLGGEVIINREELNAFFDVPVLSRYISKDYVKLYIPIVEIDVPIEDLEDLPDFPPQT
jgi:hypothetical protein